MAKLLVVDDATVMRLMIKSIVSNAGHLRYTKPQMAKPP